MKVSQYWKSIQRSLFPEFEHEIGVQTPKHGQIMVILDLLGVEGKILDSSLTYGRGRPSISRAAFARAFVSKAILNLNSTRALIDRLQNDRVLFRICGFDPARKLPCEASFSNAYDEFSRTELPQKIHEIFIRTYYKEHLQDKIVGHLSRDATDISAREKVEKVASEKKGIKKIKRLKGKHRRIVRQQDMSLIEMLEDLPKKVDASTKRNHSWKGYKLHLDVADGGIPISAILTSASTHDSQVALPLEEMSTKRVTSLYTLMDAGYDCVEIKAFVESKGKVAIIEPINHPKKMPLPMGHAKVMTHIMWGIIALAAEQSVKIL